MERLKADAEFQAQVKVKRAKLELQRAAEEAASKTAVKRKAPSKPKKYEDNLANFATNRGNLEFYSGMKVAKDAAETFHETVGQWFEFFTDQLATFCKDQGVDTISTDVQCRKFLKRQGIFKDYHEMSGMLHDLLLNDECAPLLASEGPATSGSTTRRIVKREK